ncbi:putative Histidine kinase [Syntrophobacter sp. SbD1]|nr:putative Histidine kinase [Syntrophobacter sp. SbD1]
MNQSIRILHLEDDAADAELVEAILESAGLACRITRVQTCDEFREALRQSEYDIILADYSLPAYDGMSALRLVQELDLDVPFIFVSGTMGEDAAIEGLTEGATDYVLKKNLSRLASAVKRALRDVENRREHKRAEEELLRAKDDWERTFDAVPDLISILDKAYRIVRVNKAMAAKLGVVPAECIGLTCYHAVHGTSEPPLFCPNRQLLGDGIEHTAEIYEKCLGGDFLVSVSPFFDLAGELIGSVHICRDITEQKRADEALRESEELYRTLVSLSPDAISVADLNGLLIFSSPKAMQMFGDSPDDEILGRNLTSWVAPEEQEKASVNIQHLLAEGTLIDTEFTLIKKDGTSFIGEVNAAVIDSSDGSPMRMIVITRDITQRKRGEEERKKLEEQFFQAQKMESVGRLAGGVAHDFNNMLGVIIGRAEMAMQQDISNDKLQNNLREILKAGKRSADLTRQLLAFARKQTTIPKILDLNDTISGMLNMLRRLIGEDIDLSWQPGLDLWKVKIDPSQVDQILANLAVNARDAISGVGAITLRTENVVIDDSNRAETPEFISGQYVLLTVSDTGTGMSKEVRENIFEPFFTTKELGKGTGLGLSTVYGIVKQNDGFIYVASELAKGTTFQIYLPRFEAENAQVPSGEATGKPPTGTETILLVEDDESILDLTKVILEELGYTVLAASTPKQAIHLVEEHPGDIHLLITDVVMPEMNGRELAKQLGAIRPNLKCLYMSGYTTDVMAHRGILDEGVGFIQKPFLSYDLAAKVRQVLVHRE